MTDAELAIVVKLRDMFSKQLDSIVKNTDKSAKQMEGSWKKLTAGITAAKVAVVGWLTGQAAQAIKSTADLAAKVDRANVAFGAMAKRIGVDATEAIRVMREASDGAVSDLDLMAAANRAIMLGAVRTTEELRNLTFYGAKLGNAMGLAASQGIDYFTTGLARQSNAILDNVGLIIDLEGEYKRLGKTAADLTEDQRRSIFGAAVWRQAQEAVKSLGSNTATTAQSVDKLAAAWDNLKNSVSRAIGPLVEAAARTADLLTAPGPGEGQTHHGIPYGAGGVFESKEAVERMLRATGRMPVETLSKDQIEALRGWHKSEQETDSILKWREEMQSGAYPYRRPNEEDASYVSKVWEAMATGAKRYYETVKDAMGLISTCVYRVFQDIETNLGDIFFDAMQGKMKSFKDYLKAFVQDISRTLSQMMARQALGGLLSLVPSFGAALIPVGGIQTPLTTSVYPAHQYGGITSGPSLAGEAGPEAIVPLPHNRKIPVELRGGSERAVTVNFNISAVDGASVQRMLAREGKTITAIIQDALGRDSHLRAAVQGV